MEGFQNFRGPPSSATNDMGAFWKSEYEQALENNGVIKNKLKELDEANQSLQETNQSLQNHYNVLQQKYAELQQLQDGHIEHLSQPQTHGKISRLQGEIKDRLIEIEAWKAKYKNLEKLHQQLIFQLEDLRKNSDAQVGLNLQLRNDVHKMKAKNDTYLKTISDLVAKRKEDQTKIEQFEAGHQENDNEKALKDKIASLENSFKASEQAREEEKKTFEALAKETNIVHLNMTINDLRNKNEANKKEINGLKTELKVADQSIEKEKKATEAAARTVFLNRKRYPDWMTQVSIQRFPFIPQLGDRVVYFPLGHTMYLDECKKKTGSISKDYPSKKLKSCEYGTIEKVEYRLKPYRCAVLWISLERGRSISFPSQELVGVADFIIPRELYERSIQSVFKPGDQIEALIDGKWWTGTVQGSELNRHGYTQCYFNSIEVKWDDEEEPVDCSPWDIQPLTLGRSCGSVATSNQIEKYGLISVKSDDWKLPSGAAIDDGDDPQSVQSYHLDKIISALPELIYVNDLSHFRQPVNTVKYPEYLSIVPYSIDLQTIRQRAINKYYRTLVQLKFDIQLIASNAIKYNGKDSEIAFDSMRLVETLFHVIGNSNPVDAVQHFESLAEKSSTELAAYQMELGDPNIALEQESSTQIANETQGFKRRSTAAKARESWNKNGDSETTHEEPSPAKKAKILPSQSNRSPPVVYCVTDDDDEAQPPPPTSQYGQCFMSSF